MPQYFPLTRWSYQKVAARERINWKQVSIRKNIRIYMYVHRRKSEKSIQEKKGTIKEEKQKAKCALRLGPGWSTSLYSGCWSSGLCIPDSGPSRFSIGVSRPYSLHSLIVLWPTADSRPPPLCDSCRALYELMTCR